MQSFFQFLNRNLEYKAWHIERSFFPPCIYTAKLAFLEWVAWRTEHLYFSTAYVLSILHFLEHQG